MSRFSGLTPEQLLEEIRIGAEVGRAIAERRTSLPTLSQGLKIWIDLLEHSISLATAQHAQQLIAVQIAELQAGTASSFVPPNLHAWRCTPDSGAASDMRSWVEGGWPESILQPPHEDDQGPTMRLLHRIVDATIDNLRAVAELLADGTTTRAPLALARIVLDGTAHAAYVLDPAVDPEERLTRTLNELLSRAGEDYNAAVRASNSDAQGRSERAIREVFDAVGERRQANWNQKRQSMPFIGPSAVTTARMIRLLLEDASVWSELSGVVHNKESDGWRMMLGLVPGLENPHRESYIALYSFGAILGAVRVVDLIASYNEWDLSAARDMSPALCLIWADASGLRDDAHRSEVLAARDRLAATVMKRPPKRLTKRPATRGKGKQKGRR